MSDNNADGLSGLRSAVTRVPDTASSVELLAANAKRREVIIYNDSTAVLYVKFGTVATSTDFTIKLQADQGITSSYRGAIAGIWASDSTGGAQVTEIT